MIILSQYTHSETQYKPVLSKLTSSADIRRSGLRTNNLLSKSNAIGEASGKANERGTLGISGNEILL